MEAVKVVSCGRCHLRWIEDGKFDRCPFCRYYRTIAAGEVRLTTVDAILEGPAPVLPKSPERGEGCKHGFIDRDMCEDCNN